MKLNKLFFFQLIAHLSVIPMLMYSRSEHYIYSILMYFITGCIGMSMTYHRLLAHKSWKAPKIFEFFGTFVASLGLTGSSIAWSAIHKEHHIHTDTHSDPHSPNQNSFFNIQFLSMLTRPKLKYAIDLMRCPYHRFIHNNYFIINLIYALAVYCFIEPFAIIYLWLFPAFLLWNAGSLINTVCHRYGYRNFTTKDKSRNNLILGYLMWGEGWHNNHHKFPARKSFKIRWFELDISGLLIKVVLKLSAKLQKKNKLNYNGT